MNYSTNTPNVIGGTPSIMQRASGLMNFKTIGMVVVAVLLILFAYYTYKHYADKTATLMLFYVDWCPHCKTAKPEWESLKSEYDGKTINGYTINFMEYNCTTESDEVSQLMDKYNIEGYPTIKLIKDNQVIEYDAKPTKSTMEQFLQTVL